MTMAEPRGGGRRGIARPFIAAVVLAGAATSLAALPGGVSTASAAVVYVLAVTGASALGGLRAGLAASVLSFLALNFFFTRPYFTLTVAHQDDLVALVVFLVVSGIVGTLLSVAVSQRGRAERREREALLLHRLGTRLLSGEALEEVLGSFARAVTELFGLAGCEIRTDLTIERVASGSPDREASPPVTIPMMGTEGPIGEILLFPRPEAATGLTDDERSVVQTLASQMGLALQGRKLGGEASEARLDAETNRLRAALFSSVTHDLRTPLASITASVTSLLDEEASFASEDRRELLETIRQEAVRLDRLVGNLLDLSRLRAGALVPAMAPGSIEEVVEGVVSRLQPILGEREIRFRFRDGIPPVSMDVVRIDQVVTNLLENAVKFSAADAPISVSIARWRNSVEVRVSDRGPGIPPEIRERVFEPFTRAGDDGEGTGLGLSIVRAIVESHGGKIWIEQTPGGGATVAFRLSAAA